MRQLWALVLAVCLIAPINSTYSQSIDWEKIDAAFGRKAAVAADVHRYGFPRS